MKRTVGIAFGAFCWLAALGLVGALVYMEVFVTKQQSALYSDLLRATQQQEQQAHAVWYNTTGIVGLILILAGMAYLMYVKYLQPMPDQERVISGLKRGE